jgi:F-type H+-transporting ATPase subunit c
MHMPTSLLFVTGELGGSLTSGSIHVGLGALGAAIAVGLIGAAASSAVGRNPGAATKVMVQSILAIAFAEAIVFYTLFLVK